MKIPSGILVGVFLLSASEIWAQPDVQTWSPSEKARMVFLHHTWLMVVDSAGNVCQYDSLDLPYDIRCSDGIRSVDNKYLILGTACPLLDSTFTRYVTNEFRSKPLLVKCDEDGAIQWVRDYPPDTLTFSYGTHVAALTDGSLLLYGSDMLPRGKGDVFWLRHVDKDGELIRCRELDRFPIGGLSPSSVDPLLLFGGRHTQEDRKIYRATKQWHAAGLIARIDPQGDYLWKSEYGEDGDNNFLDACVAPDSGIVAVGYSNGSGEAGHPAWIVKTDHGGKIAWQKHWRDGEFCEFTAVERVDRLFLAYGGSETKNVVAQFDETGTEFNIEETRWTRTQRVVAADGAIDICPATVTTSSDSTSAHQIEISPGYIPSVTMRSGHARRDFLTKIFVLSENRFLLLGYTQVHVTPRYSGDPYLRE